MNSVQGTTNTLMLGKVRIAGVLCTVGGAGWLVNGVLSSVISQLGALVTTTPIPVQKVRLVASEVGEGRTRLTVVGSRRQGEWSDESPDILAELEWWIVKELEGTPWPP